MRARMEAQMENQLKEKADAMQVEIERKMQEKLESYLNSMRFFPVSPQDVSSGTGQVVFLNITWVCWCINIY